MSADIEKRTVRVWDWPVRLTHWALLLCVVGCFGTAEYGWLDMQWHFYFGYAVLVLVIFRVLWGFFGSEYARFASFLPSPKLLVDYLRGRALPTLGHNPLGALSVLAMLGLLLLQGISGLFNSDQVLWFGPLSEAVSRRIADWMHDAHQWGETALLIFIGVHIAAIAFYQLFKRQQLIIAMFTGRKHCTDPSQRDARMAPWWLALLLLSLSAAALWALLAFWPRPELLY
jgi:cytochrome b